MAAKPVASIAHRMSGGLSARHKFVVRVNGAVYGPYEKSRMFAYITEGRIASHSVIAQAGTQNWVKAGSLPDFAALLRQIATRNGMLPLPDDVSHASTSILQPDIHDIPYTKQALRVPAGLFIRLAAFTIDLIACTVAGVILATPLTWWREDNSPGLNQLYSELWVVLMCAMILIWFVMPASGRWQATPGQRVLGIHLIERDGSPVGGRWALIRFLISPLSLLTFYLGALLMLVTPAKTALHDLLTGTRMIHGRV